jgi:hypothetical protein
MAAHLLEDVIKLQGLINGLMVAVLMVEVEEEVRGCLAHHARLTLNPLCPALGVTAKPAGSGRPDRIAVSYTSSGHGGQG